MSQPRNAHLKFLRWEQDRSKHGTLEFAGPSWTGCAALHVSFDCQIRKAISLDFRPCLVPKFFYKIFQIHRHIESYGTYIEY